MHVPESRIAAQLNGTANPARSPSAAPDTFRARRLLLTLLLLPVLGYAAVMSGSMLRRQPLSFEWLDLGLLLTVLAYACAGTLLITARKPGPLGRFLVLAYSVLLALGLGEAFLRYWKPLPDSVPITPYKQTVEVAADQLPGLEPQIEVTVNELGLRGPTGVQLDQFDLRILCVGASTTQCFYVTDKQTWPWLLQDRLSARLGKSVFVGNSGRGGHITLNHDFLLKHYPLAPKFEWVVLLLGQNDLSSMLISRDYQTRKDAVATKTLENVSLNKHRAYYVDLALVRRFREMVRQRTAVEGENAFDAGGRWIVARRQERQEHLKKKALAEVPEEDLRDALATYRTNLNQVITTCQDNHQQLLIMTQPTLYQKDMPPELQRLLCQSTPDHAYTPAVLAAMMDAFNGATRDVCQQRGIDCIDLASLLPKDTTVHMDDVHLNISGCDKVANIVCDYFVNKLTHGK